jgi:hypothetical protein
MNFNFGDVLGRTWKIGWNHKVLWLWQMLPGLAAIVFVPLFFIANPFFIGAPEQRDPMISGAFSLLNFLVIFPSIFLAVLIQLTTTYGAVKVEKGMEKHTFGSLFRESLPYFWRVLGLYLLFGGILILIWTGFMALFMFIFLLSAMFTFTPALICIIPIFLLFIPILVVGYSVGELAQVAIVADNMKTVDAISQGWKLFRKNWLGVILLMLLLYVALYIISNIFALPAIFPMIMLTRGIDSPDSVNKFTPALFFVVFPLMFMLVYMVQGILLTFFQTAWAVTYLRLSNNANTPIISEERPIEAEI